MIYLFILFLVGAVGIGSLLVQQRRANAHLQSAEGFLASLEKIAPEARPGPFAETRVPRGRPVQGGRSRKARIEARRRAAARRRLEERRERARANQARSRSAARARARSANAARHPSEARHPGDPRQGGEIRRRVPAGGSTRTRRVS